MPYTPYQNANLTATTVLGGAGGPGTTLGLNDTTLYIQTGAASSYPTAFPYMILLGVASPGLGELAQVTAGASNVLTIVKGAEGTTKQTWGPGSPVQQVLTSGELAAIQTALAHTISGTYNVLDYLADPTGGSDSTTPFNNAYTAAGANGKVYAPAGTYLISGVLNHTNNGVTLYGDGPTATTLIISGSFSGAEMINLSGNHGTVRDLAMSSNTHTSSSNPVMNGIEVTGQYATLSNLDFTYVNGWCVEIASTASTQPLGAALHDIHWIHTAGGVHTIGNNTGSNSFGMQTWMTNVNGEIADGNSSNLDGIMIEDSNDIMIANYGAAAQQGTSSNSALHIKGASSSVFVTNPDIGVFPQANANSPTMLIESGTNGSPNKVSIMGGIIQSGSLSVRATAGTNISFHGVHFRAFTTIAMSLESAVSYVDIIGCIFNGTQTTGSSGRYDISISNASCRTVITGNIFRDVIGSSAGQVNNTMSLTSGNHVYCFGNDFEGATFSNAFASNNYPNILRNNINVNPIGLVSISPSGSPYTIPSQPTQVTYYLTGGTTTQVSVGGNNINITSGAVVVPPQTACIITYSAGAPTVVGIGD